MKLALASIVLFVASPAAVAVTQSSKSNKSSNKGKKGKKGGSKSGKGNRSGGGTGGVPPLEDAGCGGQRNPETDDVNPRSIDPNSRMLSKGKPGVLEVTVNTGTKYVPNFSDFTFPTTFRAISGANSGGEPVFGRADVGIIHYDEGLNYGDATVASEDSDDLPEIVKWSTDGVTEKPSCRNVSNAVAAQGEDESVPNPDGISDWLWQWGQFMDHDLTEVPQHGNESAFDISIITAGDEFFEQLEADTLGTANEVEAPGWISLSRSEFEPGTQEPLNEISGLVDAGTVYGNTEARLAELLADDALGDAGTGRLATSEAANGSDLMPLNENGFCNGPAADAAPASDIPFFFLGGDIRASEQLNLAVIHTLWVREHNYWADCIRESDEDLTGAEVFEMARTIIQAEIQHIHYTEFLPIFVGAHNVPAYTGYNPEIRPDADNVATGCAYRGGHTFISNSFPRTDDNGDDDPIMLRDGFFQPQEIFTHGLNPYLRGLSTQVCQAGDPLFVFDLRNLLLNGLDDLFARNCQRGRDHGLPTLNIIRESLGLEPHTSFDDFQAPFGAALSRVYATVDDVECFAGMMSEVLEEGSQFGDSQGAAIARQWLNVRDGDQFYYENILTGALLEQIQGTTLADVIERNADTDGSITVPGSAFFASDVRDTLPLMSEEALNAKFGQREVAVEIA